MGRVPELRFPEFSGEWEKTRLGKLSNKPKYGINAPAVSYNPALPTYLRITDIDDNGRYIKENPVSVDSSDAGNYFLKKGDIVFARTGATVGKSYMYDESDGRLVYAGFLIKFSPKPDKLVSAFVKHYVETSIYWKWVNVVSMRSGQPGINSQEYALLPISLPSLPEQQKIADFLTAIDEKITLTTDKISQLETYKRGMMQKLLSGELRFPGFSGEWREVKLGEIATFSKGKGISKNDIDKNGAIKCIRYGELYTEYNETIDNVKSRTNIDPFDLVLSKKNDIIIPASGETPIDIATASCVTENGIALGGDLNIVRTTENGIFLAYYLNSIKKIDIAKLSQGISVVHLYSSQLKTLRLKLPAIEEQNKITHSISTIVNKLTLEKEKLDQLKRYKQGLLQRMFV